MSFDNSFDGLKYYSDFLSRLRSMNMPAGVKMIHCLFPKDQIQVPYLQVVRTFFRG